MGTEHYQWYHSHWFLPLSYGHTEHQRQRQGEGQQQVKLGNGPGTDFEVSSGVANVFQWDLAAAADT